MRLDPKAISSALALAKRLATKIDPGLGGVSPPIPGIGAPLLRQSGGRADFAAGGAPNPSVAPDFADSLYSHGQRVAEALPGMAQPEQMRSMLQQNGVKGSEMKWSGVNDDLSRPGEVSSPDVARAFSRNMFYPDEKVLRHVSPREAREMQERHASELRDLLAQHPEGGPEGAEELRRLTYRHRGQLRHLENTESPYHGEYTFPGGKNYREILLKNQDHDQFSEPHHFGGEPNIIASLRMKDRTDAGTGLPVAHLEELQSDWGQAHRRGKGAPTAPFVDKTDDWMGLGLKRALHEAVHGGHDKLAWTPGDDQFERFSDEREPEDTRGARLAGMRNFYDKMLPKRLLQIAKQHDPEAQITTAAVKVPGYHSDERDFFEGSHNDPYDTPQMKHLPALQITPRMRESIKKHGFPMYQRGGAVDGYADGGEAGSHNPPSAYFEVAPGKTWDPGQQEEWERLHPHDKAAISNQMISEFLKRWQHQTGIEGEVKSGLGGYGGFSNPNFTFHPKNPKHIDAVLKGLGTLFRQDAMMGAHAEPFENSFPSGVVRVHMPKNVHPDEAHAAYEHLNRMGLAEGHSTDLGGGTMDILTDEAGRHETARKIDAALRGRYSVSSYPTHVSFPEHGEHYGISGGLPGGPPAPPAPQAHDHLQAEAASRLQQLLGAASQRQSAQVGQSGGFKRGGEVDPSYAGDPGLFDLSSLHETPKVKQFDLPRNVPARGIPARVSDLMSNKDVFDKAMAVIHKGRQLGGERWYNADPLRLAFMKENGPEKGDQMFRKYMDFVAATSPRSKVGANVRNASYYFSRHASGHGLPDVGDKNPQPYGHLAQRLHQMNAHRVAGEGWDPLNNPKPASFAQNLMGNQAPATVDTHAFRLPAILSRDPRFLETSFQSSPDKPKQNIQKMVESGELSPEDAAKRAAYWQAMPKENEYGAMEQYYKRLARESGITPAQAQAAAWVGGGHITGLASDESKPFMGFVQDRIMKTAGDTNMEPKDVLRKFVRGEMPLRASGGSVDRALSIAKKPKKK